MTRSVFALAAVLPSAALAQAPVGMELDLGSALIKEPCLGPCACAIRDIRAVASGGYSRTFVRDDLLFRHFAIDGVQVTAAVNGQEVQVEAQGEYIIGGEVALLHRMTLTAQIGNQLWNLDSGLVPVLGRHLPAIDIAMQSEILGCTRFSLALRSSPTCPADFNEDGSVDFFDYDDFVACYEGGDCPSGKSADYDGDGAVDMFDYDAFVRAFEAGC